MMHFLKHGLFQTGLVFDLVIQYLKRQHTFQLEVPGPEHVLACQNSAGCGSHMLSHRYI